jgi:hypothetical protein
MTEVIMASIARVCSVAALCCIAGFGGVSAQSSDSATSGPFQFQPLASSSSCDAGTEGTYPVEMPFVLPAGYVQAIVAREGDGGTTSNWDMNTLNETGPLAGRFLYRAHESDANGQISVTDLETGSTMVLVERADWNRMDGIVWTPWNTLLSGEEMRPERTPSTPDPLVPQAQAGLVYEVDPATGNAVPRPALGARAHEGIRFDPLGNIYGISETAPNTVVGNPPRPAPGGYIFKFTPDRPRDLASGQLYALKIVDPTGDRTGEAVWVPLDRAAVQIDADAAATAAGATGYGRPEDVEIATSTGNNRGGSNILYVAVTDERRVLRIDLNERGSDGRAFVSNYVLAGVNAPFDPGDLRNQFTNPDNLALDKNGNLYIAEDVPISGTVTPVAGRDIWVAIPGIGDHAMAASTVLFASTTLCRAEPTGIYFDRSGQILFANLLHGPTQRQLGSRDFTVAITPAR